MSKTIQILVRVIALAASAAAAPGCGQKGDLYLPQGPAAAGRATLPQTLLPDVAASTPLPAASTPAR